MPPKKGKAKKEPEGIVVDGTNISALDQDQLMKFFIAQVKELQDLKRKRSFEEEERDLYYRQLEAARETLRKQEAENVIERKAIQDVEDNQFSELKVYKQRANYLKYELENDIETEKRIQESEMHEATEQRFKDRTEITEQLSLAQRRSADEHQAFQQDMKELTAKLDTESKEIRKYYMEALEDRQEFLLQERDEAEEEAETDLLSNCKKIDQQRLENITHLQVNFERNFSDVKRYFQELTYHNLSMVEDLKGQSTKIKAHVTNLGSRLETIQAQNKRYQEPMKTKQMQLVDLTKQVDIFHKDEAATERVCQEITHLKTEREDLKNQISKLEEEFSQLQGKLKTMKSDSLPASSEAKRILGAEANVAHEKATRLKAELDRLKNEMKEKLVSEGVDPQVFVDEVTVFEKQCMENIARKQELELTASKLAKVYNDSLQTIRYLVEEFQLPIDESVDLNPVDTAVRLASRPAEITRLRHTKHVKAM